MVEDLQELSNDGISTFDVRDLAVDLLAEIVVASFELSFGALEFGLDSLKNFDLVGGLVQFGLEIGIGNLSLAESDRMS